MSARPIARLVLQLPGKAAPDFIEYFVLSEFQSDHENILMGQGWIRLRSGTGPGYSFEENVRGSAVVWYRMEVWG